MSTSNNVSWYSMSDLAIIQDLGKYLKNERIQKNWTQSQLAEHTGLDRSTISQIENGRISTMMSFIQILRALEKLDVLNIFQVRKQISPLQMLKMEQNQRKRVKRINIGRKGNSSW